MQTRSKTRNKKRSASITSSLFNNLSLKRVKTKAKTKAKAKAKSPTKADAMDQSDASNSDHDLDPSTVQSSSKPTALAPPQNSLSQDSIDSDPTEDSFSSLCPICYDNMLQPIKLSCKHIFCYLCVKGAYKENKSCPMCRSPIDKSIINKPKIDTTTKIKFSKEEKSFQNKKIEWFYESDRDKNCWWRFDIKTSMEIEQHYLKFAEDPNYPTEQLIWYTADRQKELLRKCGKCHLCFACLVSLPPKMQLVSQTNKKFTNQKYLKFTVDCINMMILDNAIHLGVHIPHGYPSAAGNRRTCKDYKPIENFEAGSSKNFEAHISGSVYIIDFIEKIQYAKNGTGRPRLIRRMDELDDEIDEIKGTAGVRE